MTEDERRARRAVRPFVEDGKQRPVPVGKEEGPLDAGYALISESQNDVREWVVRKSSERRSRLA
jgi:hypothetical protein